MVKVPLRYGAYAGFLAICAIAWTMFSTGKLKGTISTLATGIEFIPWILSGGGSTEARVADRVAKNPKEAWIFLKKELLDLSVPRAEAIRIAKAYLGSSEPGLQYAAAEVLFILGDSSGATTLIQFVGAPSRIPIATPDSDLRKWAASTLAEYRYKEAANAVAALYASTKDENVRTQAAQLGAKAILPGILEDMQTHLWKDHLEQLGFAGGEDAVRALQIRFENPRATIGMRVAAAVGLVRSGREEPYLPFLLDVVERYAALRSPWDDESLTRAGQYAMRGLGCVHNKEVQRTLENAVESKTETIVETALVQLVTNYPESTKGRERLIQGLDYTGPLDAGTLFRLASMSSDPEIRRLAAERNDLLWQRAAVHEKDWDKGPWLRENGAR